MRFRYSRWDGTQDPFGPDVPAADVLEELADEILMGGGADDALQRLLRRGMRGRFSGMDALRQRLRSSASARSRTCSTSPVRSRTSASGSRRSWSASGPS